MAFFLNQYQKYGNIVDSKQILQFFLIIEIVNVQFLIATI